MFYQHTLKTLKSFYICLNYVVAQSIVTDYLGSKPSPSKPFEQLSYTAKRQKGSPCSRKFVCYSLHHHNELVNNAIMTSPPTVGHHHTKEFASFLTSLKSNSPKTKSNQPYGKAQQYFLLPPHIWEIFMAQGQCFSLKEPTQCVYLPLEGVRERCTHVPSRPAGRSYWITAMWVQQLSSRPQRAAAANCCVIGPAAGKVRGVSGSLW